MNTKASNEQVTFRLLQMPCCHILICWVNPRRPNYCPECGARIFHHYPRARWENNFSVAWLRVENPHTALIPEKEEVQQ
jgi:hypothetical protein